MAVDDEAPGGPALSCPYPDCAGLLADARAGELWVCPTCHRPAARCPRHGRHGRCAALNRPPARFCRHCRQELEDGWAAAAWLRDLTDGPTATVKQPLQLGPPLDRPESTRWVLCLDDHLPTDQGNAPCTLQEVGGWLWVGAGGGRWLLADPFSDVTGRRPLAFGPLWPGGARQVVRARAGGLWLALHSQYGIKAANLLALDDPDRDNYQPLEIWQPGAGEELLTGPVLLRVGRHRP